MGLDGGSNGLGVVGLLRVTLLPGLVVSPLYIDSSIRTPSDCLWIDT